jgi:hypothetical protein
MAVGYLLHIPFFYFPLPPPLTWLSDASLQHRVWPPGAGLTGDAVGDNEVREGPSTTRGANMDELGGFLLERWWASPFLDAASS